MSSALSVPQTDWFVQTFVALDDMIKSLSFPSKPGPQASLSEAELVTCILFRYEFGIKDWYHTWKNLKLLHSRKFPFLPSYKNFLKGVHHCFPILIKLLQPLLYIAHDFNQAFSIVDSTALPVCHNRWIKRSKLFTGIAKRGMSSLGWFYGFKLHAAINHLGQFLGLVITPGNVDDRKPVPQLLKWFKGVCVADAGYIADDLVNDLHQQGILFLTCLRKSMGRITANWQQQLLNRRSYIEAIFSVLKDKAMLYSTQARSLTGYMINVISCLFVYQVKVLTVNW